MSVIETPSTVPSYSRPEVLVSTSWVKENLLAPEKGLRVLEVDYDPLTSFQQEHIPGAALIDWRKDMNDPVQRDIIDKSAFEKLMRRLGVSEDTPVVLYGDFNNWFATYAFWVFKYYGHNDVRIMNGGRKKWIDEDGPRTREVLTVPETNYIAKLPDHAIRIHVAELREIFSRPEVALVDVRSPAEYSGQVTAPPEYPTEHAQRGGHIPRAANIPWAQAVNQQDGTFKSTSELRSLYEPKGVTSDKEVVTYCRIGERAAHSWFVLKYLLGYPSVRVYDASWTEWGNMQRMPIEK